MFYRNLLVPFFKLYGVASHTTTILIFFTINNKVWVTV
jgi:hypothetical protein